MTPLSIPDTLPSHTRTWLAYLDSAIAERVGPEMADRIEEAQRQHSFARQAIGGPANAAYFLELYATMLNDQQFEAAGSASLRVWPPLRAREVA